MRPTHVGRQELLTAGEALTCPYAWGRYDVLCLPPSFPDGGMVLPPTPTPCDAAPSLMADAPPSLRAAWSSVPPQLHSHTPIPSPPAPGPPIAGSRWRAHSL